MPVRHRRKKLLVGMHPIGPGFIQCRCATGPVFVCRAPKRLALKEAAMTGGALRRVDLLPVNDQCRVFGIGNATAPTSCCWLHVSRKDHGDGHSKDWNGRRPKDRAQVHFDAYGPASTRMIDIMPLSS